LHTLHLSIILSVQVNGVLAAVDVTEARALGDQFKIQGFPTGKFTMSVQLA